MGNNHRNNKSYLNRHLSSGNTFPKKEFFERRLVEGWKEGEEKSGMGREYMTLLMRDRENQKIGKEIVWYPWGIFILQKGSCMK